MEKKGYLYIITNQTNTVLYTGVTNSLKRRISEHFLGQGSFFTNKYKCYKLVYFEVFPSMEQAITREKQIKHFNRSWKIKLIEDMNPSWGDLFESIVNDPDFV